MSLAIETRDLGYRAGRDFTLERVNLHVPAGAIYGFLGPNGSGKTTTIRLLLGMLRPIAGEIVLLGEPVPARLTQALGRIGFVPERPHLHRVLTVAEAIDFHRAFHPAWDRSWARELMAGFELAAARKLAHLSKGEMGKLMMLLALCQTPDLLILDEPTDGLDPVVRRDLLAAIVDYVARRNATVLISSHLVHELERLCDWVGLMDHGRLIAEMPMEQLKTGTKRLRIRGVVGGAEPPFAVLSREPDGAGGAWWVVDGWRSEMRSWFEGNSAALEDVIDLDLEEGFVERLRSRRTPAGIA